jgi:rod shape-determining protein MreD
MAERGANPWNYRMLFVALAAAVAFAQLLPIETTPGRFPGPDILMLLAFSWVVMRPDYVPVWLLAGVFMLADLLFMRPPGLWTALVIMGTEFLRVRSFGLRETPFLLEWLLISGVIFTIFVLNSLILALFAVAQPGLGLALVRLIATILAYPLVVILAGRAFGLRKIVPGEVDRLGHRQ